jgi:hypothetical protein
MGPRKYRHGDAGTRGRGVWILIDRKSKGQINDRIFAVYSC